MPLEYEITKKENNLLLKQYKILKRVKYLENDKIIYIKYYLGENKMKKQNMTIEDLALIVNNLALEMRAGFKSVNDRLGNLERDVSELKIKVNNIDDRLSIIEREATKYGWDLNSNNN